MEERPSTLKLMTELCTCLQKDLIKKNKSKSKNVKKMVSNAFEILLKKRNLLPVEDTEDEPTLLVCDIYGHIYSRELARGEWTEERNAEVQELMERAERMAQADSNVVAVLKLLLCLADSAPPTPFSEEQTFGLDMRTLISDKGFKHNPLLRGQPTFTSKIFDFPNTGQLSSAGYPHTGVFNQSPGTGLRFQEFFAVPSSNESRTEFRAFNKCDDLNANFWILPQLPTENTEESSKSSNVPVGVNQDEGYVTPCLDLESARAGRQVPEYIPWEKMYLFEHIESVYTWEDFGSARKEKEKPFLSQNKEAHSHVWNVINSYKVIKGDTAPVILKTATLEEFERALKSLMIGVQSSFFQYNEKDKEFILKEGTQLYGVAARTLQLYCEDFKRCAICFHQLSLKVQHSEEPSSTNQSLIYKMQLGCVQRYLQVYQGIVLNMPSLSSLTRTSDWVYLLQSQLQFLCKLLEKGEDEVEEEPLEVNGSLVLARLYNEVPLVTSHDISFLLYYVLHSCCSVYFRFLSKWIFEGECEKHHKDFFITSNPMAESLFNRKFWTRRWLLMKVMVPGFLKGLENDILVCGKSMALLKTCAPDDILCQRLKRGGPGLTCCFTNSQVQQLTKRYEQYKEEVNAKCRQAYPDSGSNPPPDEEYYAALRAKTIEKIQLIRKEEDKVKAEKKRKIFDELKQNMEDAEARKVEDRRLLLEEEELLRQEAERLELLNDLRNEEEKQKLVQYYTLLSESADRRKEKAEWKIKRAQLHDKRVQFFKDREQLEESLGSAEENPTGNNELANFSTEPEKKTETLGSSNSGSGDFFVGPEQKVDTSNVSSDTENHKTTVQTSELTSNAVEQMPASQDVTEVLGNVDAASEDLTEILGNVDDEKREWLIALSVADKARQSAMQFKERNMNNDYNILTGEVKTFSEKFGKKTVKAEKIIPEVNPVLEENLSLVSLDNVADLTGIPLQKNIESKILDDLPSHNLKLETFPASTSKEAQEAHTTPNTVFEPFSCASSTQGAKETTKNKSSSISPGKTKTSGESLFSEEELNVDEMDMTTIYQNLRVSITIPLSTQLKLANDAVMRLMLGKHNLYKHIECIRRYFFFVDGEFSRNLTRCLFYEIQVVEHPSFVLNVSRLNSLLRSSAVGTSMAEEYTERLSFFVKEVPSVFRLIDPETLDCLSMRYKTYWPLNVVITDEAILKCDRIFTFMMQIQRASWALEQDIYLLKDGRLLDSQQYRKVQLHRHIMSHFITSLKNYVTAVVLEESWYNFKEDFQKAKTLNDVYSAHVKYIKMLIFRSLLNKRSKIVNTYFVQLFGHVLMFHEILRSGEWLLDPISGAYQHSCFSRLIHQMDSFLRLAGFLYKYIDRLISAGYQPHLVQLLSLLSGNDFYKQEF